MGYKIVFIKKTNYCGLTVGKTYEASIGGLIEKYDGVVEIDPIPTAAVCLLNDDLKYQWYNSKFFISLEEYRNQQIEKILI